MSILKILTIFLLQVHISQCISCRIASKNKDYKGIDNFGNRLYLDQMQCKSEPSANGSMSITQIVCPKVSCQEVEVEEVTLHLRDGPKNFLMTNKCGLDLSKCQSCKRVPYYLKLFGGSPNETVVDVGRCQGTCLDGNSCRATRIRQKAIPGPNGDHLVDVTEACSCQASCYRMDYFVSYFDYIFDSPNGTKVIAKNEKVMNIGKCMGSCTGASKQECWAWNEEGNYCWFPPPSEYHCVPDLNTIGRETFLNSERIRESVAIVNGCICSTG